MARDVLSGQRLRQPRVDCGCVTAMAVTSMRRCTGLNRGGSIVPAGCWACRVTSMPPSPRRLDDLWESRGSNTLALVAV